MRKLCLLLIVTTLTMAVKSQGNAPNSNAQPSSNKLFAKEPANPFKDKLVYHGYTIRIIPAFASGYGYAIFQGKKLLVHQDYNPFTMSPSGLHEKDDAYKVAKWEVDQIKASKKAEEEEVNRIGSKPDPSKAKKPIASQSSDLPQSLLRRLANNQRRVNQPLSKKVAEELQINLNQ